MITKLKLAGSVCLNVWDEHGELKDQQVFQNLVVNTGLNFVINRMSSNSTGVMSHMNLGSNTTAAAASQTDLISPLGSRVVLTSVSISNNSLTYSAVFGPGSHSGTINECGVFNSAGGNIMLCRAVTPVPVTKTATDTVTVTWTITATGA